MAELDDLFTALKMFKEGVNQYQVSESINKANQQVAQIRSSADSEAKKREQLQQISQALTTQLAAQGTPATTIQQVAGAVGPKQFATGEQMIAEGVQADNPALVEQGQKVASLSKADEREQKQQLLDYETKRDALDRDLKRELMGSKSTQFKPLTDNMVKDISKMDEELIRGKDLYDRFEADQTLVGLQNRGLISEAKSLFNPKFSTYKADVGQWFDTYRARVTGQGAGPKELALLEKNRPSVNDSPEVYRARMKSVLNIGDLVRTRFLTNLAKGKRDVSGYLENSPVRIDTPTTSEGSALQKVRVRDKTTGQIKTVLKDPKTGLMYEAK